MVRVSGKLRKLTISGGVFGASAARTRIVSVTEPVAPPGSRAV